MLLRKLYIGLVLCLFYGFASAAQDDDLQLFFSQMQSFKADFRQQVFGPRQVLQQTTSGQVIVQRPGKFRWDYQLPYQQYIVADGDKVWLYDVDLEQVTVKSQDQSMANTPASLLSDASQLQTQFDVMAVNRDGRDWFELIPKRNDSGFEMLFLAFDGGVIREMELQDSFGQMTRIEFTHVIMNETYASKTFELNIPANVDVIDETASE